MPKIPDAELAAIKQQTDLVALVRESGVELRRAGRDWIGLCPFHADTEPSLVVSPHKGLYQCLGACASGGSAIDWVLRSQGVTFLEAVDLLKRRLSLGGQAEEGSYAKSVREEKPAAITDADAQILERVFAVYREGYERSPEAQAYARSRGLTDRGALERFGLGFAEHTLDERLGLDDGDSGRALRAELVRLGVVHRDGREHLEGSLVFALRDRSGRLVNLYGRSLQESATPKAKRAGRHLYLPGPRRGIWNAEGLAGAEEVILCESIIDAWSVFCAGFANVTASFGTNGFTQEHLEAMVRSGVRRVLLAFDHDKAGNEAAPKLAETLARTGIGTYRVLFPKGMDANDYALKVKPSAKAFATVFRSAVWLAGPKREEGAKSAMATGSAASTRPAGSGATEQPEQAEQASSSRTTPAPSAPTPLDPLDVVLGERRWRVRGWEKNLSYEKLSVVLRVSLGGAFFLDTVDLVQSKHRAAFLRAAAAELGLDEEVLKQDLRKVHLRVEELQDRKIQIELGQSKERAVEPMAPECERRALEMLRSPDLLDSILEHFARCGIVGERTNLLTGYLAVVSRKLEQPLAILVQSSSAAGKSSLLEAILALVPEEDRVVFSALTGQSLFYMGETDLKHKILAIVEEEGAERASYALKLLQSEGELTIASTGKDPTTGRLVTHEYRVEGPVMLFLTTTSIEIDEELLNRCLVLSVDESREQTRAIHRRQRERRTLEGLLARRERAEILELHRNAQRLLRPLPVVNPYAKELTFLDSQTRTRRDHEKYLTLIDTIALLHQHQRESKTTTDRRGETVEYVEVSLDDIAVANRLAGEVFGHSLDELPPQTRRFLGDLDRFVDEEAKRQAVGREELRFARRQLVEQSGWSHFQVKKHLDRLVELEYVLVHGGSGRGQTLRYELVYSGEGQNGEPFLLKLLDVEALRQRATKGSLSPSKASSSPSEGGLEPPKSPHFAPKKPPLSPGRKQDNSKEKRNLRAAPSDGAENAHKGTKRRRTRESGDG